MTRPDETNNQAKGAADARIIAQIATELGISQGQVARTIALLDEGNTIPFIARYRKERTGELNETQLRTLDERLRALRGLHERREEVLALLTEQGNLTPELEESLRLADSLRQIEDLYRPYRPKRRTRATAAREKGLESLGMAILAGEAPGRGAQVTVNELAGTYVNEAKGVASVEEAIVGAQDIIAELVSDDADVRSWARDATWRLGRLRSEATADRDDETEVHAEFRTYADFSQRMSAVRPHQTLAINRGEAKEALRVKVDVDADRVIAGILRIVEKKWVARSRSSGRAAVTDAKTVRQEAIADGYKRLLAPSVERDVRSMLTAQAEEHALQVFSRNLRQRLLVPPSPRGVIIGMDPGYRTGCKVAVIDATGRVLRTETIYPHPPQNQRQKALKILGEIVRDTAATMIAIGDGTASRESEQLAADLIKSFSAVRYIVVSEAGASVYSASELATQELPDLDVTLRGAVSIARRVQDPLAELVKIDPKSIGVGMYQHDVNQRRLEEVLGTVVESCVNFIGVELNTASEALLRYVAGVTAKQAKAIVEYRSQLGAFRSRQELLDVPGIGAKTFEQCAGFLRIAGADDPLDNTSVHPESYDLARSLLQSIGMDAVELREEQGATRARELLADIDVPKAAAALGAGVPTVRDIIAALSKRGRDPREDLPPPIYRADVLKMEDLEPGMVLTGSVTNVVDFGAFVDIGVKKAGLVHVSKMGRVTSPYERVCVGDTLEVRVLDVDHERGRISLALES